MTPAIVAEEVTRTYDLDGISVPALRGVSFTIPAGDYVAIVGPSGSGKSTLMHLLGGLDRPTSGQLSIGGRDVASLNQHELARLRNATIGFVFQSFHLLARTTAVDNVALPLVYRGIGARERRGKAAEMLERVGLGHRLDHRPNQLSGGEQQRVAIARALVTDPEVLLADEPTGNLDTTTGQAVLGLLEKLNGEQGSRPGHRDPRPRGGRPGQPADRDARRRHRMRLAEAWRVALDALRANRLRSGLTMLGVIIGVAAVVILVAIGTGTKNKIEQQVEGLGSNLLIVVPGQLNVGSAPTVSRLDLDDIDDVAKIVGDRNRVAVTVSSGETVALGQRLDVRHDQGVTEIDPQRLRAPSGPRHLPEPLRRRHPAAGGRARRFGRERPLRRPRRGRPADHHRRRAVPGDRRLRQPRAESRRGPRQRGAHPDHHRPAAASAPTGSTGWPSRHPTATTSTSSAGRSSPNWRRSTRTPSSAR